MNSESQRITVVNIVSSPYSGSTWLNLVLGSHDEVFSVGEVDAIAKADRPTCKVHHDACPLWPSFDIESEENPYLQVARLSGRRVLVVNNSRRLFAAQEHPRIDRRFIFLIRDGRAVVASNLRKHAEMSAWTASRSWRKAVTGKRRKLRRYPAEHVIQVHYETMLDRFDEQIERVCTWLGLEAQPGMREYWKADHHPLSGNGGPFTAIVKYQTGVGAEQTLTKRNDAAFYAASDPGAFNDQRWKADMTDRQLRWFAIVAGRLNRSLGYGKGREEAAA